MKKKHQNFGFTPLEINGAKQKNRINKSLTGFTLAEILIVVAIFILIIVTVYSAYALSQQGYQSGEEVAEITQNGRVILERMSREIRQAKKIVTELPEEPVSPPDEIIFQDGHFSLVSEEGSAQGESDSAITLASTASSEDNYYKDMFIKIIGGTGAGQIRKIYKYDGTSKEATIEGSWDTNPVPDNSTYKIDTSYYYIHYYLDASNNIQREVITYCFSEDISGNDGCLEEASCVTPETYVSRDAVPPSGQCLLEVSLEEPRIIGEYATNLEFWGARRIINIFLILEERDKSIELKTKIFGRNL